MVHESPTWRHSVELVFRQPEGVVVVGGRPASRPYFPGATKAVDEFMAGRPERIQKLPYALAPAFVIK